MRPSCRTLVIAAIVSTTGDAHAQSPPPSEGDQVRLDLGVAASAAAIDERRGVGLIAAVRVPVSPYLTVGGRIDVAVMFGGSIGGDPLPFGMAAAGLAIGEVGWRAGAVRPTLGLGLGVYSIGSYLVSDGGGIASTSGRYVGVAPSAGIDVGRLRLAVTYHAVLGTSVEYRRTTGGAVPPENVSQRVASLELTVRFGS